MTIHYSSSFVRSFHKLCRRNNEIRSRVKEKLSQFTENPSHPSLRLHKLTGEHREDWSMSIDRSLRIIFQYIPDGILLVDIGKHADVY